MILNGPGRLASADERWSQTMHPLQKLSSEGGYDLCVLPAGSAPNFDDIEISFFDWGLRDADPLDLHPSMKHAYRELRIGPAMAHHVDHWSHVLRVNQLALLNRAEVARLNWDNANIFKRIWLIISVLWRAKSFKKTKILSSIGPKGKNCKIHPTAVIEACDIGDDVEIGPHTVLRASVIEDGAKIEEFATVNLSVVGKKAKVGRYAMSNLCVLYSGSMISHGGGYQASVFGRDAFIAWGAAAQDLSFGKHVQVQDDAGQWVDSGQHFLGVAVGHRSAIGNGVRLSYGVTVPNDALLVGGKAGLIKNASKAPPKIPSREVSGEALPIKSARPEISDPD